MAMNAALRYVKTGAQLVECVASLSRTDISVIAIDTEAAWWRYGKQHEKMSLIQIAADIDGKTVCYVIDCLAGLDLVVLGPIFANKAMLKIAHNAQYDARKLNEHHGFNVAPIWCTLSAERRAGSKKNNKLIDLAKKYFNEMLDKTEQDCEWGLRPLTTKQLLYAAKDSVMCLRIYHQQKHLGLNGEYVRAGVSAEEQSNRTYDTDVVIPGLEGMFKLSKLHQWLRSFIASGNAREWSDHIFLPDGGHLMPALPKWDGGRWRSEIELYARNLERWIAKISGEEKYTLEDEELVISHSECIPLATDQVAISALADLYAYVQEGKRTTKGEESRKRYFDKLAADRYQAQLWDHEYHHEKSHVRYFEEERERMEWLERQHQTRQDFEQSLLVVELA